MQPEGSISSLKKASRYSLNLSILKNIYDRYGNINFYIEIYSDVNEEEETKTKKYLNWIEKYVCPYTYDGKNFYVELKSNGITISTLSGENTHKYIDEYLKNFNSVYTVDVKWNYSKSNFELVDNIKFDLEKFRLIHPNTYFDKIYVINLKKDIERKDRIEKIFGKYNISCEFFEAVYGKELSNLDEYKRPDTTLKTPGQYGYILSMIKILTDAKKNNYKKILVCDDDIILRKNFLIEFDSNIKSIPYDWKLLFLGLSGPWAFDEKIFLHNHNYDINYTSNLTCCDGSFCVGYDSNIYDKIIEISESYLYPFDTQLIKYLNENTNIDRYAFYPHLVIADTLKESQILNYSEEKSIIKNFERNYLKFMINLDEYELDTMDNNGYKELQLISTEKINNDNKLMELYTKNNKEYKFILICSTGRTGSTTLQRIINTIPNTNIYGENDNTILHLLEFCNSLDNLNIINKEYNFFTNNNLKPCWYNNFDKEILINQIKQMIINFLDKDNVFKTIGFKEIRYNEINIDMLKIFFKLFPNTKIILNYRNDVEKQAISSWFKDESNSKEKIIKLNKIFKDFYELNREFTYLFSFEDLFDSEKIKSLFEYLGESNNFDEQEIKKILENNLG